LHKIGILLLLTVVVLDKYSTYVAYMIHYVYITVEHKILGSARFLFFCFWEKLIRLSKMDALNWSKVTVKTFIMSHISNKWCSFLMLYITTNHEKSETSDIMKCFLSTKSAN